MEERGHNMWMYGYLNSKIKLEAVILDAHVYNAGQFDMLCHMVNPITLYSKGTGPFYSRTWYMDEEGTTLADGMWVRYNNTRWNVFFGEFISAPDCS